MSKTLAVPDGRRSRTDLRNGDTLMKERDVHALDQLQEPGRADAEARSYGGAPNKSRSSRWQLKGNSTLRPQLPDMKSEDHHHHHHFTTSHCTRTPLPASAWRVAALPRCSSPSSSSSWRGRASGPEPQNAEDSDGFFRLENRGLVNVP